MVKYKKTSIIIVILVLISGISIYYFSSNNNATTPLGDYISITFSEYVTENTEGEISTQIWSYDYLTKETEKVFEFEYSSQYPLGYYDKKNQLVYYTKRVDDGDKYGDQIFLTDLSNNTEKQLTKDLFAVNYIIPTQDKVFFAACPYGDSVTKLGSIDKETNIISYWGDDDTNIEAMTVDNEKKKIFVSTYSMEERRYNLKNQEGIVGQYNFKMPKHTVFQIDYDFQNTKELFSENMWIRTLMTTADNLVAVCDIRHNESATPSIMYYYNLITDTAYREQWDASRIQVGDGNYSSDGSKIYGISINDAKRGLYEYNSNTKAYTPLFIPDEGFINNIQISR